MLKELRTLFRNVRAVNKPANALGTLGTGMTISPLSKPEADYWDGEISDECLLAAERQGSLLLDLTKTRKAAFVEAMGIHPSCISFPVAPLGGWWL